MGGFFSPSNGFKSENLDVLTESEIAGINMDEYLEECAFLEFSQLPDHKLKEFLASEECRQLQEAGIIGKNTVLRLSKADDLTRRIKLAALQQAKDKGDNLWKQWDTFNTKKEDLESKILQKYNFVASKMGKLGQKNYLKTHKISNTFIRN